ncbi:MAG TPA: hypothetical protein VFI94_14680 [Pseudolabrys sp.]|nr:hypothetical protein [Pseudolabrys sp.]
MGRIFWMTLVAALAGVSTQASAQVPLHDSRYEMVTTQLDQNISFGASIRRPLRQRGWEDHNWFKPSNQVIILDKRTGQLWSWYETFQTINYLGQIFPLGGSGSIARIVQVPEQR